VNLLPVETEDYCTYPESPTRFRYVNGGGTIGRAGALLAMFTDKDFWPKHCTCNQQAHAEWFCSHPDETTLDYHCKIFQTLYHAHEIHPQPAVISVMEVVDGRLHNMETGSWPLVCHGNGGRAIEALSLWEKIRR